MKPLQVYIPEKRLKQLKQEALDKDTTVSDLVRSLIGDTTWKPLDVHQD